MMKNHLYDKQNTNLYGEAMTACGLTEYESRITGKLPDNTNKVERIKTRTLNMSTNRRYVTCGNCKGTVAF